MPRLDVCLSPNLVPLYQLVDHVVVVIDVLRATSCVTTALAHGVKKIVPVSTLDECRRLREQGFVIAAEREGQKATGFDLGNSPFEYMDEGLRGKAVALTTTNGTRAVARARTATQILAGSFLNLSALAEYLRGQPHDVLLLCAGWKGTVSLEDTLCAGALAEALPNFTHQADAVLMAQATYRHAATDLPGFMQRSSHVQRLAALHIEKDIEFCLRQDVYNVIPVLRQDALVAM